MKNIPAVKTLIENEYAVQAVPEVVVDWNMNRYFDAVANNTPDSLDYAFDDEFFPMESIVEPLRPTKGINKARIGSATIGNDYLAQSSTKARSRYYIADIDDTYKYWTSPDASDPSTAALSNCKPQVVYPSPVSVNKIVIKVENSWASPATFSIQTTTLAAPTDADWTEIANQSNLPAAWKASGEIVLYFNGSSWRNATRTDNVSSSIRGVRIVVSSLEGGYEVTDDNSEVHSTYVSTEDGTFQQYNTDGKDARFDLIEISARREVDLSAHVISFEDTFDNGEVNELHPIGTVTTNEGTLTLSNIYLSALEGGYALGLFSAENTESPYYQYIDANAEFNIRYVYYDNGVEVGAVQQAHLFANAWNGQSDETVQVSLSDHSKFFNETTVRAALWENLSVPEIVWRILDSIGFVNYQIDRDADKVTEHIIPIFYTDGETNAWELLDQLSQASQTAIYFDEYGTLQVKTREFAYSPDDAPVWTFNSHKVGSKLEDIVSFDQTDEFEPNYYKVTYQKTDWAPEVDAVPTLQQVWEPEGTVALRGTPLVQALGTTDQFLYVSQKEVVLWPYKGMLNIDSELITYEGKEYVYYTGDDGNTKNTVILKSDDEAKVKDDQTPWRFTYKNYYTGGLAITERGVWNSEVLDHPVDATGYTTKKYVNGTASTSNGFSHLSTESKVKLHSPKNVKGYGDILMVSHGASTDTPFYYYGTKFKITSGNGQYAGMAINTSGDDGYYVEFTPSKNLGGKERKTRKEMIVYSRNSGKDFRLDSAAIAIGVNIEYEVDLAFSVSGSDHKLVVWVNGKQVSSSTISGAHKNAANGRFAMFVRGKTTAEYEYIYAVAKQDEDIPEDFSFMDKVKRSYVGNLWFTEWVYELKTKTRRRHKHTDQITYKVNERFMDDFGPYVHEIREYDIKFDPAPVLHSRLYLTNDWSATVLEYRSDPFSAHFIVANTYRGNAVINGDDSISFAGTGGSVNQVLTVFGRAIVTEESETVIASNDDQIRRRGKIEAELTGDWIQSKEMAQDVADWLEAHFSYGNANVSLEVFGNPLIQVGDIVHVDYPEKHIDADYFVVGTNNSFDQGITTTLTLRERV